jgi:transposase InsO family protein
VKKMCAWLGVSASGFFGWRGRPASATARRRAELAVLVTAIFDASDQTYGYRRVHAQLAHQQVHCGPELVRHLMRELDLVPCQPRPWRAGLTASDGFVHDIPDLLEQDFTADAPGTTLIGDITYIPTWAGWLYLATVIDVHTRMVIGYAMDDNYRTPLITAALRNAARNQPLQAQAIFHSDRGSNYTSAEFAATIDDLGMRQSMGRTGVCYDNAMAESFFAALKNERVNRTAYPTREHARADITRYIEFWYNPRRLHSGLDYNTPQEALNKWTNQQTAA